MISVEEQLKEQQALVFAKFLTFMEQAFGDVCVQCY